VIKELSAAAEMLPRVTDDRSPAGRHSAAGRRRYKAAAIAGAMVVLSVVSVGCLVGAGYAWWSYRKLDHGTHRIAVAGLGDPSASGGARAPAHDGQTQNILVVGVDSRAGLSNAEKSRLHVGQGDVSTSTDTLMLIHIPANGKSATLVSIPRDTYVDIPGHPSNKINAAYADGYYYGGARGEKAKQAAGASLLVATVRQLTGVPIDHYVQVGFAGFVDIVKAIGNIPINLCETVDDTHAHNVANGGDGGSGFTMSAGPHQLDPVQALEFVRQRHNIPGPISDDLGRELRQRYFLSAAFKQVLSLGVLLNPVRLQNLISAVQGAFTFDGTGMDMEKFAEQLSDLSSGNIKGQSIPTTGSHDYGGTVGDALTVDPAAVATKVQQLFGRLPTPRPAAGSAATTHSRSSSDVPPKRSCVY
jgi:LCP family protein required for cell wall assembly